MPATLFSKSDDIPKNYTLPDLIGEGISFSAHSFVLGIATLEIIERFFTE